MTDQEIKEKLAKAAGFVFLPHGDKMHGRDVWQYPEGLLLYELPEFPYDMDACLAWIVPSIKVHFEIYTISGRKKFCCNITSKIKAHPHHTIGETMPLAFCLAALKYFKEMEK